MGEVPKLRDFEDGFDPFMSDDLLYGNNEDPYPVLAELREKAAVVEGDFRVAMGLSPDLTYPTEPRHFMVLRYDEITDGMKKGDLFSNKPFTFNIGLTFGIPLTVMDAPEHPRYRPAFQKIFLPHRVKSWGSTIVDPVVDELLEEFVHTGEADLVEQFTLHYPFRVIYRQLGLPDDEGEIFHKLAVAQTVVVVDREHAIEAGKKLGDYFQQVIALRRANPGDDLISLIIQPDSKGETLPDEVVISFLRQLINAAGDTTFRTTGTLLATLLKNPDQLEALRQDRSLMANAIEEGLRFEGPNIHCARWATQDTEIAGVKIPGGSFVHFVTGAANRDPSRFTDPDRYDIRRPNASRHMGFALGPHICVGQHLARVEITRALTALLDRLPNLRLDPDKPAPNIQGGLMRRVDHLYVKFDPA